MFKKLKDFLFGTKSTVKTEVTNAPYKLEPAIVDKPIVPPVQEVMAVDAPVPTVVEIKTEPKKEVAVSESKKSASKKTNNRQKTSTTKTATTAKKKTTAKTQKTTK